MPPASFAIIGHQLFLASRTIGRICRKGLPGLMLTRKTRSQEYEADGIGPADARLHRLLNPKEARHDPGVTTSR